MADPLYLTEFSDLFATWGLDYLYNWGVANGIHLYPPIDTFYPMYYYDCTAAAWKMYDWYNSRGETTRRDLCEQLASMGFNQYLAYYNSTTPHGGAASWNMFPEGLYVHSVRATSGTERANAKQALADLNANCTYTNYSDAGPTAYLADFFGSRECAYFLKLRVYNYLAGNSALDTAACNQLISWITGASGHFKQWQRAVAPPSSARIYMRPFMVMISCKALIAYHDKIANISNLFSNYIVPMWDYIYDTAAYYNVGTAGSMYPVAGAGGSLSLAYTDVNTNAAPFVAGNNGYGTENTSTGGVGGTIYPDSVDLNWFIAPLLARIWKETGAAKWKTRFDNLWNNGLPRYNTGPSDYSFIGGIYLGNQNADVATYPGDTYTAAGRRGVTGKHVDQSAWWATDGIAWYQQASAASSGGSSSTIGIPNALSLLGVGPSGRIIAAAPAYATPQDFLPASSLKTWYKPWDVTKLLNGSAANPSDGQTIDTYTDATGLTYHAQQTTDASRSTYRANLVNSVYGVGEYSGSNFYNLLNSWQNLTNGLGKCTLGFIGTINSIVSNMFLLRVYDASYSYNRLLLSINAGYAFFDITRGTSASTTLQSTSQVFASANNTTYHAMIVTCDFTNNDFRFYVDNAEVAFATHTIGTAGAIAATNGNEPRIGASYNGRKLDWFFANDLMDSTNRPNWYTAVKSKFALTAW